MSDYEATAYLSLEKLKVRMVSFYYFRKNTCLNFSSSKIRLDANYVQE